MIGTSAVTSSSPSAMRIGVVLRGHHQREQQAGESLDRGVAPGDRVAAGPAASAERQPAEDREVVVPADRRLAGRAVRRRVRERLPARQPVGDHVQERADGEPQDEREDDVFRCHGARTLENAQDAATSSCPARPRRSCSRRRRASCRCAGSPRRPGARPRTCCRSSTWR